MLQAEPQQIEQFFNALFLHADEGTFVSLRSFDQFDRGQPPLLIEAVKVNGDPRRLISRATDAAQRSANAQRAAVFAPPVATFNNPDRARTEDLANGVAISVEIDAADPDRARRTLEWLLGPATAAVLSGGDWSDPNTGEVHPKTHLHWRLSEPTRTPEEHAKLRDARWLAAILVGADTTAAPPAHPLRWPGSWNRKGTPRMAVLAIGNPAAEVHLSDALERLQEAVEAAGLGQDTAAPKASSDPQAPLATLRSALAAIANPSLHWEEWNRIGMACWRASGGSADGLKMWADWSAGSDKHEEAACAHRWAHYATSPPSKIGAGTIFHLATRAGWVRPTTEAQEPPPPMDDPGYWQSIDAQAAEAAQPHHAPADEPQAAAAEFLARNITAAELASVAPREWVFGHFLIRRFISVLGAPGGVGKTAYAYAIALAIVTNAEITRERVHEAGNVWLYNLEDPRDELIRRLKAAMLHHGIGYEEIKDRLFLDSGRDRPLVIARATRDGGMVASPDVPAIIAEIKRRQIRVLIVDPFIRSHRLEENVNEQIDFAAALWGQVAELGDCAVLLLHHFKKGATSGDAASFRGASALIDAARAAISLAPMSEDEANQLSVLKDDRWRYVRADNAKLNLAPPPERTTWLKLVGVDLENGTSERPADQVQTVERWDPPSPWANMGTSVVVTILSQIQAGPGDGEQYTVTRGGRSERWAGSVVTQVAGKTDKQAAAIIRAWVANGVLLTGRYHSPTQRKERDGLQVDPTKMAEMRASGGSFPVTQD